MYIREYKTFTITTLGEGLGLTYFAQHPSDYILGIPFGIRTPPFQSELQTISHIDNVLATFEEYMFLLRANINPKHIPAAKRYFWRAYAANNGAINGRAGEMARTTIRTLENPMNESNRSTFKKMGDGLSRL